MPIISLFHDIMIKATVCMDKVTGEHSYVVKGYRRVFGLWPWSATPALVDILLPLSALLLPLDHATSDAVAAFAVKTKTKPI